MLYCNDFLDTQLQHTTPEPSEEKKMAMFFISSLHICNANGKYGEEPSEIKKKIPPVVILNLLAYM